MLTPNATGQVLDLHRAGKIRVLAVNSETRLKAAPDIPTAIESGLPEMKVLFFCGLFAPAGTPKPIIARIFEATQDMLRDPRMQEQLTGLGYEPMLDYGPERAEKFIRDEQMRWTPDRSSERSQARIGAMGHPAVQARKRRCTCGAKISSTLRWRWHTPCSNAY